MTPFGLSPPADSTATPSGNQGVVSAGAIREGKVYESPAAIWFRPAVLA